MRKILVWLMVLTIVFPAVLAFCHCCVPMASHQAVLSGPGMNCCDMVKTFFRDCAPSIEKNSAIPAFIFLLFLAVLFPQAGLLSARRNVFCFETGPPGSRDLRRLYLSLNILRI